MPQQFRRTKYVFRHLSCNLSEKMIFNISKLYDYLDPKSANIAIHRLFFFSRGSSFKHEVWFRWVRCSPRWSSPLLTQIYLDMPGWLDTFAITQGRLVWVRRIFLPSCRSESAKASPQLANIYLSNDVDGTLEPSRKVMGVNAGVYSEYCICFLFLPITFVLRERQTFYLLCHYISNTPFKYIGSMTNSITRWCFAS